MRSVLVTIAAWLLVLGPTVLLIAALVGVAYFSRSYTCGERGDGLGMPAKYNLLVGCRVQEKGRWIPLENYRVVPE